MVGVSFFAQQEQVVLVFGEAYSEHYGCFLGVISSPDLF